MPTATTLAGLVRELGATRPDAPAITLGDTTLTFGDLDARSSQVARALLPAGVGAGDRVVLLDRNAPTSFEVLLGAAKTGAVTVPVNTRLAAPEVAAIVADAAPRLVVADPALAHLVPAGVPVVRLGGEYEAWSGGDPTDPGYEPAPDDVVLQLYSSGTTGHPKGALLTSANLIWTARMGREAYGMGPDTVNLVASPLFHIGGTGYSLTALGQGGHTVLVRDVDPAHLLGLVERHRVTHAFLVPTVVRMLLDSPALSDTDTSSLQRIAYGGAPMAEDLLGEAIGAFGCAFMGVYGMTETAGSVTALPPEDHDPGGPRAGLLRSVGRPLPWVELRVVDPDTGRDVPLGAAGEIWVRSPQNTVGFWRQPELTARTLVAGGWLRTGDAAHRDTEGHVFLRGRLTDMVVSGGENVYPAEVENVLHAHPDVLEAAVIGVPSARWGETVEAVVVRRPGSAVTPAGLIAFARERLAHYKCPTTVHLADELPRNAAGKVLRRVLQDPS